MVSQTQCRAHAENYKRLAVVPKISIQRATVLMAISRSWITLAGQLDRLAAIEAEEKLN